MKIQVPDARQSVTRESFRFTVDKNKLKEAELLPTVDQRWLILPRYTQPEKDTKILLQKLKLELPTQPPPRITATPSGVEPALLAGR